MTVNWTDELAKQLSWHWDLQVRPRLDGLTDAEYFWEPVAGMWSVRPRGEGVGGIEAGGGDFIIDFEFPEPEPPPVTTIAWRLGHLLVGVLGARNATHFGGPPVDYQTYRYPGTAAEALAEMDRLYDRWIAGVRALDEDRLSQPCREPHFETESMAALVLHIHREMIHHCAEIALLRDLYAHWPHSTHDVDTPRAL
ncbi:MAG TPA: DinB family protein [Propionibacteriaceae bacterium]|nr:DinB family protein [Propionibacteriaceae bacterium]